MFSIALEEIKMFFWAAIGSWFIFFVSSLVLTESLMRIMHLEILAVLFLVIGIGILSLNYLLFKKTLFRVQMDSHIVDQQVQTFHSIIQSLQRIFWTIVILVSLGLMVSISTFLFISMKYFTSESMDTWVDVLPFLFLIYLIFIIPSFLGINEISRLNTFFQQYKNLKAEIGESLKTEL
ncbi:MAG: hypothetical protein ACW98F_06965 [Candidatus Hodarchaeales archaeon]|jgi:hypothetical protein